MSTLRRFLKWFFLTNGRDIRKPFHAAALAGGRLTLAFLTIGLLGGYSSDDWRAIPIAVGLFMALGFLLFGIPRLRRWVKRTYMEVDESQ